MSALSVKTVYGVSPFGDILNPYKGTYGTTGAAGFGQFISNLISAATLIAGLGFVAYLIMGAFRYLTSGGDEKAVGEARKTIFHALMGLVIIVLTLAITAVIQAVMGLDILHPVFTGP